MPKKQGLAIAILSKAKKPEKDPADLKLGLLASCREMASALGINATDEQLEAFCDAQIDFVHQAMDYEPNPGKEKY
jgi:hypothetical protein